MNLSLNADTLTDFTAASAREWLVTNGLGGYASGSLSGASTRRYHGLLVAALTPPTGRMILLSRLEEALMLDDTVCELAANQYPGAIYPQGFRYLERFDAYPAPTFLFRPRADVLLRKRIWMAHGRNTTYVQYTLLEAPAPVVLRLTPLVCWKDYHTEMHPWDGFPTSITASPGETELVMTPDAPPLRLRVSEAAWERADYWHYNVEHARERERGLDWREDLYCPGHFHATLNPGAGLTLTATIEAEADDPETAWNALFERQKALLHRAHASDDFTRALVLAADQFIVGEVMEQHSSAPTLQHSAVRSTVIAGYHWFADWGRDTMIALPGLCLATGRAEVASDILRSFAPFVSQGMLPNRFPDRGETPEYNTADATLWYFLALWEYLCQGSGFRVQRSDGPESRTLNPEPVLRELWPILKEIIDWHVRGTRYGIKVDEEDGLLRAGEPGVQLTWMDAKVGDWVVTPRIGKPVEINALWYNALGIMESLAERLGEDGTEYGKRARRVARRFRAAFVRPDQRGLYDVITDGGPDAAIRPNQIFAVSLPHSPLTAGEQKAVVQTVEKELLTPVGLRSLAPEDPAYRPRYEGGPWERDSAYHQGTVWPWLLGPFALAHFKVYGDAERARAFLRPLQAHLSEGEIGSISEIFDADSPHRPNGCIAQAWSVAETLRAWRALSAVVE